MFIKPQGPGKAQEAAVIFDELIDKYGSSSLLLNGLAVSKMQLGDFAEAETHLLESLTKVSSSKHIRYICYVLFREEKRK
jgi:hypothetical protein